MAHIRRVAFRVRHAWAKDRLTRTDRCEVRGFDLVIEPGVLHPALFASSNALADAIERLDLEGRSVLDLGTGSGYLALCAARARAGTVVATDVSPVALDCARRNIEANGFAGIAQVVRSDVFDGLPPGRFDLIVSNPPFFDRKPSGDADLRFASGEGLAFHRALATGLETRLAEGGSLLLLHSSDSPRPPVEGLFTNQGFAVREKSKRRRFFETFFVLQVTRPPQV